GAGRAMRSVPSAAWMCSGAATVRPLRSSTWTAIGRTGSLKRSRISSGESARIAPSVGTVSSSTAWARAAGANPAVASVASARTSAAQTMAAAGAGRRSRRRRPPRPDILLRLLRRQRKLRRRLLVVVGGLARLRDLDPAMHTLRAFLDDREAQDQAVLLRQLRAEDELVVEGVGQIAAAPDDLAHVFGDGGAVPVIGL